MPINANIALGIQPVQLENPINQMAKFAALQQAQQEQQMNALKMQEYQRSVDEQNQLRAYLAGGATGGDEGLLRFGAAGRQTYEAKLKGQKEAREADKAFNEALVKRMEASRALLDGVQTPEDYIAWHEGNHRDPVIGKFLAERGVTADTSRARIEKAIQTPGGFEQLLQESKVGAEKMLTAMQPKVVAAGSSLVSPQGQPVFTAPEATPDLVRQFKFAQEEGYKGTFTEWKNQHAKAGASNVSVGVNTPVAKNLASEVGKRAEASVAKAEGAAESMVNANMIREALNKGAVIAGPLAGPRLTFAQMLETAGVGDKEQLASTRTAITGLASITLASRAELKGQGQITDFETKLLEKAKSGNIEDMTVSELHQVVDIAQRASKRLWENHQGLLGKMRDDPNAQDSLRYYEPNAQMPSPVGAGKSAAEQKRPPLSSFFGELPKSK